MNIPEKFPSYGQDWFNYLAGSGVSNYTISAVLQLNAHPDADILKKSVRLMLDAEPVLGCRFDIQDDSPWFVRQKEIDMNNYLFILKDTDSPDDFLSIPMRDDQMISIGLLREPDCAKIIIKLNHTCGDAAALKKCVLLLAYIYTEFSWDLSYSLTSNSNGERSQKLLFDSLGIENPAGMFNPALGELKNNWAFPFENCEAKGSYTLSMRRIDPGEFLTIKNCGKEKGATINDMLLTSLFRNIFKLTRPPEGEPGHIHLTRDMRCYLPDVNKMAVANLSAMMDIELIPSDSGSFWSDLKILKQNIADAIEQKNDIYNSIGCEYIGTIGYKAMAGYFTGSWAKGKSKGLCSPMLSNLGILSKDIIYFGRTEVTDAYMVPPAFHAPAFMFSASSYNNVLTISAGYFEGETRRNDVEALLDGINEELIRICK